MTCLAADGQVTLGEGTVLKHRARKVHRLRGGRVVCGFAGSAADAQTLMERLEAKLDAFGPNLRRAAVEFAKDWRTDRMLRQLNAMMIAADQDNLLVISGDGNVVEPDDEVAAIGSGGAYALAAARALARHTPMEATEIAQEALRIASEICVYTNDMIVVETL
jgi:ATP-dependent HslUV protease subunit HslV